MTSNHQHVLALIENAVHDALMDINEDSESSGLDTGQAVNLICGEVLSIGDLDVDDGSLQKCIMQGLSEYLYFLAGQELDTSESV
jgi:hypothetical protein